MEKEDAIVFKICLFLYLISFSTASPIRGRGPLSFCISFALYCVSVIILLGVCSQKYCPVHEFLTFFAKGGLS